MISKGFAPAKINLTLHVTGQRPDGYHLLDSLVAFADLGDRLTFSAAAETSLSVSGPFADGVPTDRRNTVMRAADLAGACHTITLDKHLPHGAGIGGGSSDAAAVLRHFEHVKDASQIGADVAVCLSPKVQRMQGIGDQLTALPPLPLLYAVLVNPNVLVSTPAIFRLLTQKDNPAMPEELPEWQTAADLIDWLPLMRNDLQPPACALSAEISEVLKVLEGHSRFVRMSGSGSTCFGLFETREMAQGVEARVSQARPAWWVKACQLS